MDAWHTVFLDQDDCYRSNPAHASALEMAVLSRRSSLTSITLLSLSFQILRYKRGAVQRVHGMERTAGSDLGLRHVVPQGAGAVGRPHPLEREAAHFLSGLHGLGLFT